MILNLLISNLDRKYVNDHLSFDKFLLICSYTCELIRACPLVCTKNWLELFESTWTWWEFTTWIILLKLLCHGSTVYVFLTCIGVFWQKLWLKSYQNFIFMFLPFLKAVVFLLCILYMGLDILYHNHCSKDPQKYKMLTSVTY